MRIIDKTVYFWGYRDIFSNHYTYDMEIDGFLFNCVEQYMMYEKAKLFNDGITALKILNTNVPNVQKQLGRQVENFDEKIWDEMKYHIVYRACLYKFFNTKLYEQFCKFKGYKFVEASPYDTIWGVGLSENDDAILDEKNWKGQNLLGKILTDLANETHFKGE
jgi:ribA/ribD-fused uncharacterized protein